MGLRRLPTLANHCAQRASFALLQGKWIEFRELTYRVKQQLPGYSDLRQCPQHPHAASSYASVPTSPAALARVRRVAFILFGHRCDTSVMQ